MTGPARIPPLFRVLHAVERMNRRASLQPPDAVYPEGSFAWTAGLEAGWRGIRGELDALLASSEPIPPFQDIAPDAADALTEGGQWRTFVLHAYGRRAARNCAMCPRTAAACEAIPGMKTAFFSIIEPGKVIPPHRGPYNGLLRCHLGLMVPTPEPGQPGCTMRVGEQTVVWQEGKTVVFDDSHEHEVRNPTRGRRVVLFIDVLRPMRFPFDRINATLIAAVAGSPYGRRSIRRFDDWYARRGIDAGV